MNEGWDQFLIRQLKRFGLGWTAEQFGGAALQMVDHLMRENQNLRQADAKNFFENLELSLANIQLVLKVQEKERIIAQLLGDREALREKVSELEAEKQLALPPGPEPVEERSSGMEISQSEWLDVMPDLARGVILGQPGSGKSLTGHMLLELHRWKMNPYILGFPQDREHLLPSWMGLADSFDKISPKAMILTDEAYLLYHARRSGFDKGIQEMSRALGLARQREHSILFVAHQTRHLDKNIVGYGNLFIIKEPGAMDVQFERRELREVLERAREFFQTRTDDRREWAYVWSPEVDFEGALRTFPPSYWSQELSQAYAGGISSLGERSPSIEKEEKKAQARAWKEEGASYGEIADRLGVSKSTIINWVKHGQ